MRALLLYTELADYSIACLKALKATGAEIMTVHYPVNPEAPFRFQLDDIGEFISIEEFGSVTDLMNSVSRFAPDVVLCAGWSNRWYMKICRSLKKECVNILAFDNHWTGTLRQQVLRILAPIAIKNVFQKVWIPGTPQLSYAHKLGFTSNNIITGFYSCDVERFSKYHQAFAGEKVIRFPRRLICAARYIPEKGYDFLWRCFIKWKERSSNDWELWCAGGGAGYEARVLHPQIKHLGFVQGEEWPEVINATGVFVLASNYEPWGVAVHEFAAAGYPMLLSDRVGAATEFVRASNGFIFESDNEEQLITLFDRIAGMSTEELSLMGVNSHLLAKTITPASWAGSFSRAASTPELLLN